MLLWKADSEQVTALSFSEAVEGIQALRMPESGGNGPGTAATCPHISSLEIAQNNSIAISQEKYRFQN